MTTPFWSKLIHFKSHIPVSELNNIGADTLFISEHVERNVDIVILRIKNAIRNEYYNKFSSINIEKIYEELND